MPNNSLRNEKRVTEMLLARIRGEPISSAKGSPPMFIGPIPEPNRSALLGFYRSIVTEELSEGRISVLLGNMYRKPKAKPMM